MGHLYIFFYGIFSSCCLFVNKIYVVIRLQEYHIFEIQVLCQLWMYYNNFFSSFFGSPFHFLQIPFEELKVLLFMKTRLSASYTVSFFLIHNFWDLRIFVSSQGHEDVLLFFSSWYFIILAFMFRCTTHLSYFLYVVREGLVLLFIFLIQISSFPEHFLKRLPFHPLGYSSDCQKLVDDICVSILGLSILIHQSIYLSLQLSTMYWLF